MTETNQFKTLREKIGAETAARREREVLFRRVFDKANAEGFAAGEASKPKPMGILNPRTGQTWREDEGACGFAWVTVRPGNSAFAKWLVKNDHARAAYGGGVQIWISAHGQSVTRKAAHAQRMAEVLGMELSLSGITAGSRLD